MNFFWLSLSAFLSYLIKKCLGQRAYEPIDELISQKNVRTLRLRYTVFNFYYVYLRKTVSNNYYSRLFFCFLYRKAYLYASIDH